MKKLLPYFISFFLIVFVLGVFFFVLNVIRKKEAGPVVLRYVGLWDPEVINPLKLEYQKNHPEIIVEYEQKDISRYFPFLTSALNSESPPDLFWWHNSWGPVVKGALAAIPGDVYGSVEFEKTFYPITKNDLNLNGAYRGIPLEIDGLALLYNKNLLAAKGFKAPPADLISLKNNYAPILTTLDSQERVTVGGIALGSVNNVEHFSEIIGLFMLQNKVEFVRGGQNILAVNKTLDGRNLAADALAVYVSFLSKDKVWSSALPPSLEAFASGKVAMIYLPAYRIAELETLLASKNLRLNYGVAAAPQLIQSDPVSWGSYWVNGVSSKSEHQRQAWDFARFLSEKESLRKIFSIETKLRNIGRAYPRVDMADELRNDSKLGPYVSQAPYAQGWYLNSGTGDAVLNDKIIEVFARRVGENTSSNSQTGTISTIAEEIQPILQGVGLAPAGVKK